MFYFVGFKGTREEWRTVFLITAAVFFVCGTPFLFLAKSEQEKWAEDELPVKDEMGEDEIVSIKAQQSPRYKSIEF